MYQTRQSKIEARKRTYFVLVVGSRNKIWEKKYNTPCEHMNYNIKILVFNNFHEYFILS
jgi:hypothetical protein